MIPFCKFRNSDRSVATCNTNVFPYGPMNNPISDNDANRLNCSDEFVLQDMPLLPITSPETIEACRSLQVTECDVFVCSYPKSGTTWTQNLVVRLLAAHVGMTLPDDWHLSHTAPFYEVDQYWQPITPVAKSRSMERVAAKTPIRAPSPPPVDAPYSQQPTINDDGATTTYRVFNTHLRPHQLPPNAKCIYVMRDPLDVLVSFYHHLINMALEDGGYRGSSQEFAQDFLDGRILYGKWQDHVEAWLGQWKEDVACDTDASSSSESLWLHYQDMTTNLPYEATRVAHFLGVSEDRIPEVVAATLPQCSFDAMKAERWRYTPKSVSWNTDPRTDRPYDNFVRSGKVGEGMEFVQTAFTSELKARWKEDMDIAKRRWQTAGVRRTIIERYLKA